MKFNWHYLQTQLAEMDVDRLIADCEAWQQTADLTDLERDATRLIQSALMLSAHILRDDKSGLAHQLVGRLMRHRATNSLIHSLTDEISKLSNHLFPVNLDSEYATHIPAGSGFIKIVDNGKFLGEYVIRLRNGQLVCYSNSKELYFISEEGVVQKELKGHRTWVANYQDDDIDNIGVFQLSDGRILTRGHAPNSVYELFIWSEDGDLIKKIYVEKENDIRKIVELSSGRFVTLNNRGYMILWSPEGDFINKLVGDYQREMVETVEELSDGRMVSWCRGYYKNYDYNIFLWSNDGHLIHVFEPNFTDFRPSYISVYEHAQTKNIIIRYSSYDKVEKRFSWDTANHSIIEIELEPEEIEKSDTILALEKQSQRYSSLSKKLGSPHYLIELENGHILTIKKKFFSNDESYIRLWLNDETLLTQLPDYIGENQEVLLSASQKHLLMWESYRSSGMFFIWDIEKVYPVPDISVAYKRGWLHGIGLLSDSTLIAWDSNYQILFFNKKGDLSETQPLLKIGERKYKHQLPNGDILSYETVGITIRKSDNTLKHVFKRYKGDFGQVSYKDVILGEYFIVVHQNQLIVIHPQNNAIIHTFYGDAFFCTMPIVIENDDDYTIVIGDGRGRVLFLRWREA